MKRLIVPNLISLILGLLLATGAHAVRMDNLFQIEVDAAGRDRVARDAALQQALREVLVRVTGSAETVADPAAQALLKKPGRFVEQYRFRSRPGHAGRPVQLRLWVQFDGVSLAREIRHAGLPYWGRERPDVLVWLAVDDRGQRFLVSESTENEAAKALLQAAAQRGLPLTLPLMDLEDQRAVSFTDVWGGFTGSVRAASERYRPQVILLGRLERSRRGADWRAEWTLLGADDSRSWRTHADSLAAAVTQGMAGTGEVLASQYAVVSADASLRALVVEDVRGLADYARVMRYLAALAPVETVQVKRVSGSEVEFDLQLSADARSLRQVIALGKLLQAVDIPEAWRFRLNP
ncbi:MAG TPA: DUF2066 domain-containing protein [Gammaproteobacteria bacterium]|nr:DUF2066 domain-containing protein [Gammaproteobacteria bacterium]